MKTNCWLILGTMLATTAVAQVNTNGLPEIPPPASTAPAPVVAPETKPVAPAKKTVTKKKPAKKAAVAAKAAEKMPPAAPVVLVPGPATVAADHVNLRGQAGLKGEVVGHVAKGDSVTVISEINLDKPKTGEPAQWAKIALPSSIKVWINSQFVDASNNVVAVKKLNLRGGPGENYSVLGVIEKGAAITVVASKGNWTQIDPPAGSFAFVAASYLKQDANVPPAVATAEGVPPTPTTVAEPQAIAPPATTPPPAETTPQPTPPTPVPAPTPATIAAMLPEPTLAPDDTNLPPPPPRVVTHEGAVRHSVSLVAPTEFELYDQANNKAINYLYSPTTNLNLARYKGLHITVTGEEGLDARWQDTPVLTIQKIFVLTPNTNKPAAEPPPLKPVKKHWWSK